MDLHLFHSKGTVLESLLLTLNRFHKMFWCFHCWCWLSTSKCRLGTALTPPAPCISESYIKIRINWIFVFTLLCAASKGFLKAFRAFLKPSKAPQGSVKKKLFFSLSPELRREGLKWKVTDRMRMINLLKCCFKILRICFSIFLIKQAQESIRFL